MERWSTYATRRKCDTGTRETSAELTQIAPDLRESGKTGELSGLQGVGSAHNGEIRRASSDT